MQVLEMTPLELKKRLDAGDELLLLDVRGEDEYEIANLGGLLIPLHELPHRLGEIDRNKEIVVHCHHGGRSMKAAQFMLSQGFSRVANLAGGIDRWSLEVDPSIPQY